MGAHEEPLLEIDGPDALDGEDVEFNTFTVTILQPMDYELTEHFLQAVLERGGFHGVSDGREGELGPVFIESFHLRDPPTASEPIQPQQAFELPDLEPKPDGQAKAFVSTLSVASAVLAAALVGAAGLGLTRRRHTQGYVAMDRADAQSTA